MFFSAFEITEKFPTKTKLRFSANSRCMLVEMEEKVKFSRRGFLTNYYFGAEYLIQEMFVIRV